MGVWCVWKMVKSCWQFFPSQILVGDRHLFHWDLDHHHHHIPWGKRLDVENGPIRGLFDPKETHGENPDLFVNVLPWRNPGWSLGQVIPYHIPWPLQMWRNGIPSGKYNSEKSPLFVGKSTIHGPFLIAMLVYQRVVHVLSLFQSANFVESMLKTLPPVQPSTNLAEDWLRRGFSAFLLLCFFAFLLFAVPARSLFCFSIRPASLLLYFCAFLLLLFILLFLFFSHVFLLLYFLLLCFFASCLYCLFVFNFILLYSVLFVS